MTCVYIYITVYSIIITITSNITTMRRREDTSPLLISLNIFVIQIFFPLEEQIVCAAAIK